MKAKEYAVSLGLAKPGKGRMSGEAHAAIKAAIEKGMTFSDYGGTPVKSSESETVATGPLDVVSNPYADAFTRYSLEQLFEYTDDNGKRHTCNARQVCMPCGYSLAGHGCESPVVLTAHGIRSVSVRG